MPIAVWAPHLPITLVPTVAPLRPVSGWLDPADCSKQLYQRASVRANASFSRGGDDAAAAAAFDADVSALVEGRLRIVEGDAAVVTGGDQISGVRAGWGRENASQAPLVP